MNFAAIIFLLLAQPFAQAGLADERDAPSQFVSYTAFVVSGTPALALKAQPPTEPDYIFPPLPVLPQWRLVWDQPDYPVEFFAVMESADLKTWQWTVTAYTNAALVDYNGGTRFFRVRAVTPEGVWSL